MHTLQHEHVTMHHNGDFSGDVLIATTETIDDRGDKILAQEFTVPFSALKSLVAAYVLSKQISRLEQAEDDQILGLQGELT